MHPEQQLRAVIATLPSHPRHGPYSRCVGYHHLIPHIAGQPPHRGPQPLWGMGSKNDGARFTPKGRFETIYLAEDPVTALTEVEAVFRLPRGPIVTVVTPPLVHVVVDGVLLSVLDLTDGNTQTVLGTTRQELTGAWRYAQLQGMEAPTQTLGRVCYDSGRFDAIRYYSSKNPPDGICIAVFPDRLAGAAYLEVYDPYGHLAQRLP